MKRTLLILALVAAPVLGFVATLSIGGHVEAQTLSDALDAGVGVAVPGTEPPPPIIQSDEGVLVDAIGDVIRGDGLGRAVAVIALVGLVWLVRRFGPAMTVPIVGWRLLPAWFSTDRGGVVLTFSMAFLGAIGHAVAADVAVNLGLFWSALLVALTAIGGYAGARRLLWPKDAAPLGDFGRPT